MADSTGANGHNMKEQSLFLYIYVQFQVTVLTSTNLGGLLVCSRQECTWSNENVI